MLKGKVVVQECHHELSHRVSVTGTYDNHECGIKIEGFQAKDVGEWTCEVGRVEGKDWTVTFTCRWRSTTSSEGGALGLPTLGP